MRRPRRALFARVISLALVALCCCIPVRSGLEPLVQSIALAEGANSRGIVAASTSTSEQIAVALSTKLLGSEHLGTLSTSSVLRDPITRWANVRQAHDRRPDRWLRAGPRTRAPPSPDN